MNPLLRGGILCVEEKILGIGMYLVYPEGELFEFLFELLVG